MGPVAAQGLIAEANAVDHGNDDDAIAGVPFGSWAKPGSQPYHLYMGLSAHSAIGLYYASRHNAPEENVFLNDISVQAITSQLASRYGFSPDRIEHALRLKPDIFEYGYRHTPQYTPGLVYEIKPVTWTQLAYAESGMYAVALWLAGLVTSRGPSAMAGTSGLVPAPHGWFRFSSPMDGVIGYYLIKASPVAIRRREKSSNKGRDMRYENAVKAAGASAATVAIIAAFLEVLELAGWAIVLLTSP